MTTKPDELEQILQSYKGDSQAVDEDAVLRQYPEKLNQAHDDNLQEAKQAIQAHIDKEVVKARIDENNITNNYCEETFNEPDFKYHLRQYVDYRIEKLRSES